MIKNKNNDDDDDLKQIVKIYLVNVNSYLYLLN